MRYCTLEGSVEWFCKDARPIPLLSWLGAFPSLHYTWCILYTTFSPLIRGGDQFLSLSTLTWWKCGVNLWGRSFSPMSLVVQSLWLSPFAVQALCWIFQTTNPANIPLLLSLAKASFCMCVNYLYLFYLHQRDKTISPADYYAIDMQSPGYHIGS